MDQTSFNLHLAQFPKESHKSITFFVDILMNNIYPLLRRISDKLHSKNDDILDEHIVNIRNVYTLCSDQIRKCFITLLEVIKLEHKENVSLQESRQCTFERLSWCYQKLLSVEELVNSTLGNEIDSLNNSILVSPMYFVNWIDQTFDVLSKLCNIVYRNNIKESDQVFNQWRIELVECVQALHTSIDELLLSAMTLCRHCLHSDQHIVKARCQVVLRETKALLSDIIDGDLDSVPATTETLKLPIMPSIVNLLIDVLKDVLYALETNTNTALLALVVHCFSRNMSPALMLRKHFENAKGICACTGVKEDIEKCMFVKEFDSHNERLLQIGSFAMSCSSDQKRVLSLRSALASLEALDPHLVPAVMLSPQSHHTSMLINIWNQEVSQIRDNVFLIVDPAAFADKTQQMMHQKLLEITKENVYESDKVCAVINMGTIVYDFFSVYEEFEPDALACREQIKPLLKDLNKVQVECKIVSNLLCSKDDYFFDVKMTKAQNANVTVDQVIKRLKLLYTLVKRINCIMNPKNDDDFYEEPIDNRTQTFDFKNGETYVNSPKKLNNLTRSVFARTNIRSSTGKFPLSVLTKHMKLKQNKDLSFSLQLDELCNISEINIKHRERSILYHTPLKNRSLRKAVLSKCTESYANRQAKIDEGVASEKESLIDDTTSLQITDVLNQINDLTNNITRSKRPFNSTVNIVRNKNNEELKNNVLRLTVNDSKFKNIGNISDDSKIKNIGNISDDSKFKKIWNISVNESACTNASQPSDVNTLERINDLDLVESRLSDLKSHIETSL